MALLLMAPLRRVLLAFAIGLGASLGHPGLNPGLGQPSVRPLPDLQLALHEPSRQLAPLRARRLRLLLHPRRPAVRG